MALLNFGDSTDFLMPEASIVGVTLGAAIFAAVSLYLVYRVSRNDQKHIHGTDRLVVWDRLPSRYQPLLLPIEMSLMSHQKLR